MSEWNAPENMAKWTAAYTAVGNSPAFKRHMAESERLEKELQAYVDRTVKGRRLGSDPAVARGYVWLFRRK